MALLLATMSERMTRAVRVFSGTFVRHRGGNAVIVFGLSVFAVMIAIGGAIDFSRVLVARRQLQDSSDAAVLRVMNMGKATDPQRQVAADTAFEDNLKSTNLYSIDKKLKSETIGNTITESYTVSAKVTSFFGAFFGMDYFNVSVVSKAQSTMSKSEIAFVLDSTGSMKNGGRMDNLKSSVDSVLASMIDSSGKNVSQTQVAIVPFNTQVRLAAGTGLSYIYYGGAATNSQSCKSGTNGYACNTIRDAYNKICASLKDSPSTFAVCQSSIKGYTQTYNEAVSGQPTKTYFNTTIVASDGTNAYKYEFVTYTTTETVAQTPTSSTNPETGTVTTSGSTKNVTTQTVVTQQASSITQAAYSSFNLSTTCKVTGQAATCYKPLASDVITYPNSYGNGFSAGPATYKSTNGIFGGTGWLSMPAITATVAQSGWGGCVWDRTQPYDVSADAANPIIAASLYPAQNCVDSSLKAVMPLSTDIKAARDYVKSMTYGGENAQTNVTIGVQWGMEALSPSEPMIGGVEFKDDKTLKYMIVVTDGTNTKNRWKYVGSPESETIRKDINDRTALACQAAKDKGITVFVVKVVEGDSALLRACASKDTYFYDLTSATQLNAALSSIFDSIKKTRLTQ